MGIALLHGLDQSMGLALSMRPAHYMALYKSERLLANATQECTPPTWRPMEPSTSHHRHTATLSILPAGGRDLHKGRPPERGLQGGGLGPAQPADPGGREAGAGSGLNSFQSRRQQVYNFVVQDVTQMLPAPVLG